MPYPNKLILNIGVLDLPQFLPDATFGQVRHVSAQATSDCGIEAVVMNIFHLMQKPGASTIKSLGGLHRMTGDLKDGYLIGVSDEVPDSIKPHFALTEHYEFMIYGLDDLDRTLHSESLSGPSPPSIKKSSSLQSCTGIRP